MAILRTSIDRNGGGGVRASSAFYGNATVCPYPHAHVTILKIPTSYLTLFLLTIADAKLIARNPDYRPLCCSGGMDEVLLIGA